MELDLQFIWAFMIVCLVVRPGNALSLNQQQNDPLSSTKMMIPFLGEPPTIVVRRPVYLLRPNGQLIDLLQLPPSAYAPMIANFVPPVNYATIPPALWPSLIKLYSSSLPEAFPRDRSIPDSATALRTDQPITTIHSTPLSSSTLIEQSGAGTTAGPFTPTTNSTATYQQEEPTATAVHATHSNKGPIQWGKAFTAMLPSNVTSNGDYSFRYSVNNPKTGDIKNQSEQRSGDVVTGYYTTAEADGRVRHVNYTADSRNGFRVNVAHFPLLGRMKRQNPNFDSESSNGDDGDGESTGDNVGYDGDYVPTTNRWIYATISPDLTDSNTR